jgi:exonuclease VII small subunit
MLGLAKHIRRTLFQVQVDMLAVSGECNETSTNHPVDAEWIDSQERRWRDQRQQLQRLEYLATNPPGDQEISAATTFINTLRHAPSPQWIPLWDRAYAARRRQLQRHVQRLTQRQQTMDTHIHEYSRCLDTLAHLRQLLRQLPLHVKNETHG